MFPVGGGDQRVNKMRDVEMKTKLIILKVFFLLLFMGASVHITSQAAQLSCSGLANSGVTPFCALRHVGDTTFHLAHLWSSGPHGFVSPEFTFTRENTTFVCSCNQPSPVAVSVDFNVGVVRSDEDSAIVFCPAARVVPIHQV